MGYTVAVVGATGAVGAQMIKCWKNQHFQSIKFVYCSARSAGKTLKFKDQDITIEETTETAFEGVILLSFQQVVLHQLNMHHTQLKLVR